jgi:hypothetical protein
MKRIYVMTIQIVAARKAIESAGAETTETGQRA